MKYTTRSRFTLRVAAAINGDDPWACGFAEYHGTYKSLWVNLPQIRRNHGGNIVTAWYYHGNQIDEPGISGQI